MMTISQKQENVWPSDEMPPVGSWKSKKKIIDDFNRFPWIDDESSKGPTYIKNPPKYGTPEWFEWYQSQPSIKMSEIPCAFDRAVQDAKARGESGPYIFMLSCGCPKCSMRC